MAGVLLRERLAYRSYQSVDWQEPVEWMHPLLKDLAYWGLVVPHWTGGTTFRDLTKNWPGTLTGMDPATDWQTISGGFGWGSIRTNGSGTNDSEYISLTTSASILATEPNSTLAIIARINAGNCPYGERSASTPIWKLEYGTTGGGKLTFTHRDDSGTLDSDLAPSSRFDLKGQNLTGNFALFGISKLGTTVQHVMDGLDAGTRTLTGTDTLTVSDVRISGDGVDGSAWIDADFVTVLLLRRAWSLDEWAEFYALSQRGYPGLLRRWHRKSYLVPAAGGGGDTGKLVAGSLALLGVGM